MPVGDRSYTVNLPLPVGDRSYTVNYIDENSRKNQIRMWTDIVNAKDNKKLWEGINWNGTLEVFTELPDIDDLMKHFEAKGNSSDESTLLCEVTRNNYVPVLDDEVTIDGVRDAYNRLKPDKPTGDGWVQSMIPNLSIFFMTFLTTVINVIFQNHLYPTQWRTTVVKAIYKCKGLRKDARNYTPISLVHLLSEIV